jgi:type I restriction enzyme M protein
MLSAQKPFDVGQFSKLPYEDEAGFSKSAKLAEIAAHDYGLTPGRYVGAADMEDDDELFEEKMEQLTALLAAQMAKSEVLTDQIEANLEAMGYGT